jgi:ParB family chromosome partitioning protein
MSDESRPRLGRGLASLLGDVAAPANQQGLKRVPVEFIRPNPRNPRRTFVEADLAELAESIRQHGVLQPIIVRKSEHDSQSFDLIAGERRWRAAQRVGLHEIPVVVVQATDKETLELAIIENVQRSDLNPIEEALGYDQLINDFGYSQSELASAIGKSRSYLANALRLLRLPDETKKFVADGALSAGHARALLSVENPEETARLAVQKGLSVREVEKLGKSNKKGQDSVPRGVKADPNKDALEKELIDILGLPVSLRVQGEKGSVSISFNSLDQLDLILSKLR